MWQGRAGRLADSGLRPLLAGLARAKRLSVGVLAEATKPLMRQAARRKSLSGALRASRALDERVK